ncbi:MAG: hypothetical protein V1772_08210 [Chloroflexota bacterium]
MSTAVAPAQRPTSPVAPDAAHAGGEWPTRLLVLLLFVALSLGMTYPLVLHMGRSIPGPPWDNMVWLYDLWWFRHSIVDLGQWPTFNPTIFYPAGYDLRLSETMLANKALIAPVLFWADEVWAYNTFLLLSFVLTGYATYRLIAYLTGNLYAGVVAGAILAFCPYRMHAMAAGWLPLLATWWLPLSWLYLERALRENRLRHALAAGLCGALTLLSSWYHLYTVGSMAALYLLLRLRPWRALWSQRGVVLKLLAGALLLVALVAPVALPVAQQALNPAAEGAASMGWPLREVEKWGASLEDAFLPNVYHPIWGERVLRARAVNPRYPWYAPGFIYLGAVALLLAVVGVIVARRRDRAVGPLAWIGLISLVLAQGVALRWNGQTLGVAVPPWAEALITRTLSALMTKWALHRASLYDIAFPAGTVPVPLPALLVYLFVPLGNALRTLYRFGAITILAVSALAGYGAAALLGGVQPPAADPSDASPSPQPIGWGATLGRLVLMILLLALVLGDFVAAPLPYGRSEIKPQPLDLWLAARPADAVIMQFPAARAFSGDSLYRTRFHGRRVAYGHGTFYPAHINAAFETLASFPSDACLDLLATWGVTHVVVGSRAYDAGWGDQRGQTWAAVQAHIAATPRLALAGVAEDEPFWRDERVSPVVQGNLPVIPILVDRVYIYELR